MSNQRKTSVILSLVLMLVGMNGSAAAADMGTSNGHDLDALWERARQNHDLEGVDSVVLLESRQVVLSTSGELETRVHRVVWIGTRIGIRSHADLRIPWNNADSTLKVHKLRTWMDGRWWPDAEQISPTAVVETLPYAMNHAYDYASMRETMLLHDGVELPCIMETDYSVVTGYEKARGHDELWVMRQRDPAVVTEYLLEMPVSVSLKHSSYNGAPAPTVEVAGERQVVTWRLEDGAGLRTPLTNAPEAYEPCLQWSTWRDWDTAGRWLGAQFQKAAVLDVALADSLAVRLENEPGGAATARAVAAFIDEGCRGIHYDPRFWMHALRPATRTWDTAYGHLLDRAALAVALFGRAGLTTDLVLAAAGPGLGPTNEPGFARFSLLLIEVSGEGCYALYDPDTGHLSADRTALLHRAVWRPLKETGLLAVQAPMVAAEGPAWYRLTLNLEPGEEGAWTGTGYLNAGGLFSPHGTMVGSGSQAQDYLGGVAAAVLPGSEVTGWNPDELTPLSVRAGFVLELAAPELDDFERHHIVFGDPGDGLLSHLSPGIRLHESHRTTPVALPATPGQQIRVRIKVGDHEVVRLPEARSMVNDAGRFNLTVNQKDGWVTIDRELVVLDGSAAPDAAEFWTQLRALLLEEVDPANRTVLLK